MTPDRQEMRRRGRLSRAVRYAFAGLALSLGAPLGWLALHCGILAVCRPWSRIAADPGLYAYLLLGTAVAFGTFGAAVGHLSDRLAEARDRLERLSLTDSLTSLYNARYFHEALARGCSRGDRDGRPFALVMADIDLFKQVNDSHGHAVGDRVLAHVAKLLAEGARAADEVCRIGGEEFAILAPDADAADAQLIAERIRDRIERTPLVAEGGAIGVTVSFGTASQPPARGAEDLFRAADARLYESKRTGRNRVTGP